MDKSIELGTKPIFRLLIHYSIPAVIAMLVQVLYHLVDATFIGHFVGKDGLAAVTVVFPLVVLSSGFSMLVGVGTCSVVAILLGQRRVKDAEQVLGNAIVLVFVIGFFLMALVSLFGDAFIERNSNLTPEVREMATTFLRIITLSFGILPGITYGMNNVIRTQGNPHIAMGTLLIGSFLNILLNPLFIVGFGWGVAGSAWATVISLTVSTVWVLHYFCSTRSLLKLRWKYLRFRWRLSRPILLVGLAPFLTQLAASFQGMLLVGQLSRYGGDNAVAIWGVIYRTITVLFLVVLGLYQGAQPLFGYNFGAKKFARVRLALFQSIAIATVWCTLIFLFVQLFPNQLVLLFTKPTPAISAMAPSAIHLSLLMCPLIGFQVITSHYFQAVGKPILAIFLSLTRQIIILIPCLIFFPKIWGILGVWSSFAVSDACSFLLTVIFLCWELKNLRKGRQSLSIISTMDESYS